MAVEEKSSRSASSRGGGSVPDFPKFPPRFIDQPGAQEANADIQKWNDEMKRRWVQLEEDMKTRFKQSATFSDAFHTLEAEIDEERITRANADAAFASYNLTVTARLDDVESSVDILATAEALVNGFLDASCSVQVTAGNVVTGIRLFSSTGGGTTDVSYFAIQADRFQINTATGTRKTVFTTSASDIKLGDVLVVDLTGQKMFIGAGNYGNADTAWYVDSTGKFSLKDKLTFDGSVLTLSGSGVTGAVDWATQVTGKPGFLTDGRIPAAINAAGLVVTGIKPGIVVSPGGVAGLYLGSDFLGYYNGAAWKTYMDSAGNFGLIGSGSNSLTWNGATLAIVGAITSTVGMIGGFTLGPTELTAGSLGFYVQLLAGVSPSLTFGTPGVESTFIDNENFRMRRAAGTNYVNFQLGICQFDQPVQIVSGGLAVSSGGIDIATGQLTFATDTNLYRSAASTLRTDDNFSVGGGLSIGGTFNTSSITATTGTFTGALTAGSFSPTSITTGSITATNADFSSFVTLRGVVTATSDMHVSGAFTAGSFTPTSFSTGTLNVSGAVNVPNINNNGGNLTLFTNGGGRLVISDLRVTCLVDLKLNNPRIGGAPTAGGTVRVLDSNSNPVQLLCL